LLRLEVSSLEVDILDLGSVVLAGGFRVLSYFAVGLVNNLEAGFLFVFESSLDF